MKLMAYAGSLILLLSCGKKAAPSPKNDTGNTQKDTTAAANFKVSGSKILDPAGNEFVAKGVNVNGPYWPWARPTIPDASLITDVWKFNTVRVDTWPEFSGIDNNNTDLDGIIKAFTDKKVVAIIEEHGYTGTYPTAGQLSTLTGWWATIADKYKNNPYVWFNTMNEPGNSSPAPQTWSDDQEAIIKAIRGTGAKNIIVLDENNFGQASGFDATTSSAALTYGPSLVSKYQDLVFSLHMYDAWIYGYQRLSDYLAAVKAKGLAVMIGEYGTAGNYSSEVAADMFKNCVPAKIGRVAWQWTGVDIHQLTTGPEGGGYAIDNTSGAKPGNLSYVGNLVWDDNHNTIDVNGAEAVPPAVLTQNLDFEDGAANGAGVGNGWINFGTATLDNTPGNVSHGAYSVKIAPGSAGGCGQPVYLAPNTTYQVTAWGKNSAAVSSPSSLGIKSSPTYTGNQTDIVSLNFTETAGTVKSATFTTPATIGSVFLYIYKNDAAATFWMDNIIITKQ